MREKHDKKIINNFLITFQILIESLSHFIELYSSNYDNKIIIITIIHPNR